MRGTGARAFSSCLHGLPLAGAFSVGSTSPRELAVRRRPTPSLGQPQESSQGWATASGWLSYHPAPGTEGWPLVREVPSCAYSQGNTWRCCLAWAGSLNNSLVCSIVPAFSSEELTTPSHLSGQEGWPLYWREAQEFQVRGGLFTISRLLCEEKREGFWSHQCPAWEGQVWVPGVCGRGREARRKA